MAIDHLGPDVVIDARGHADEAWRAEAQTGDDVSSASEAGIEVPVAERFRRVEFDAAG